MRFIHACQLAFLMGCASLGAASAQPVKAGAGTYFLTPKGSDKPMPSAPMRTEAMLKTAAQTNQWYSTLIFNSTPEAIFAHPLSVKPTAAGFEMALPGKEIVPTVRRDVEVHYPHKNPLLFTPTAFEPGPAKLAKAGDWSIDISMARGADDWLMTVAHGSPFVSMQVSRGDMRVRLPSDGRRLPVVDPRVLVLQVGDKAYALFGPAGVTWESVSTTEWTARLPAGKGYLSAAALPDAQPATLELFARHAYAFITDTRVEWTYDPSRSQVETSFKATTRTLEGPDNGPLLGLYPHQWFQNASVQGRLGPAFDTIRGKIHVLAANSFQKTNTYSSFVPFWPAVGGTPRTAELDDLLKADKRTARRMMLQNGQGPYWQGKGIQRNIKLMDVAEQQGDQEGRDQLLAMVQKRMEEWFSGGNAKGYFHLDKSLGVVAAYPDEFFQVAQINDHHFTYGYWIRTAAEIALRDPAWAAQEQWGAMVDLLVADIATTERSGSAFPFLRNFDPYEGHSWASGIGLGEWGNNQESSSEAINAWVGLILWGEVTGNKALRDLGVYLFTAETEAINFYWFDIHGLVFAPEYKNVEVSMLFGGKYAHNTWWTDEPRQIKGINLLPITTASTYLGVDPGYVKRNLDALGPEVETYRKYGKLPPNPPPRDIWQDVFAKYGALADPTAALASWDRWGSVEVGETRTHALHFLLSLQQMGLPDFSVRADTLLYAVFKQPDGRKTYLAYNAGTTPMDVTFSDGKTLTVAPRTLGRVQ
ncbi:MAG: glycosyl hydrolase [Hydrogenophaga sp.]|nr:glycosyl hydrolase [Hydrogenophaga sp.]